MPCRVLLIALFACAVATAAEVTISAGDELARQPAATRDAAVRARWAASPATLPTGRVVLADAIAALSAGGNPVSLGEGVDGAKTTELPGFAGDWWSALLTLCDAYGLEPAPGQMVDGDGPLWGRGDGDGQALRVAAGPVVLVPRGTGGGPRFACGPVLLEVHELSVTNRDGDGGWVDVALRARVEPRFAARDIGRLSLRWRAARAGDVAAELRPRDGQDGVRLRLADPLATGRIGIDATIVVNALSPLRVSTSLQPGDSARIDLGERQLLLKLLDAEQARGAGKRTPCAILTYPADALAISADLTVLADGKLVPSHGSGTRQGRDGECEQIRYFANLAATPHEVVIQSAQRLGSVELPLAMELDLQALPTAPQDPGGDAADVATTVSLPGGELSLGDAARALRGANEVLLDLGVDARARATVPAGRLGFWDAVLTVAKAFRLDLMPPQGGDEGRAPGGHLIVDNTMRGAPAPVCGGTLGLGRLHGGERPLALAPCGPVLVEVLRVEHVERRTLAGTARLAILCLRLRLEPRIARELVSDARIVWSSAATDDDGVRLAVGGIEENDQGDDGGGGLLVVQVAGLVPTSHRFTLAGQLLLHLQRPVRGEATLEPGGAAVALHLGSTPLTVALTDGQGGEAAGVQLVYASDALDDYQVSLRGPDGVDITPRGRSSRGSGRQQTDTWHVAGLQPGAHYTVILATDETLALPVIPLAVPVELP